MPHTSQHLPASCRSALCTLLGWLRPYNSGSPLIPVLIRNAKRDHLIVSSQQPGRCLFPYLPVSKLVPRAGKAPCSGPWPPVPGSTPLDAPVPAGWLTPNGSSAPGSPAPASLNAQQPQHSRATLRAVKKLFQTETGLA